MGRSLAIPDIHQGHGFPSGGVAATDPHGDGVVSPGGVGFDINCGVRMLGSSPNRGEVHTKIRELVNQLFRDIPSAAGHGGNIRLSYSGLDTLLVEGAGWMVEHGYGEVEDLTHWEQNGAMEGTDPGAVSEHARKRGLPQLGTLGSGNTSWRCRTSSAFSIRAALKLWDATVISVDPGLDQIPEIRRVPSGSV